MGDFAGVYVDCPLSNQGGKLTGFVGGVNAITNTAAQIYVKTARDQGSLPLYIETTWVTTNPASSPPIAPPVGPWVDVSVVLLQ